MAKSRTEVGTMVRGMGMGMKLLELLVNEIKNQGGEEEVLAFLTRPRFEANLKTVVKAMINCDWRIPASEMCFLAEAAYRKDFEVDADFVPEARNLWWYAPLYNLGIPYDSFSSDPMDGEPAISRQLLEDLHRRKMEYPLRLLGGNYVVVNWSTGDELYKPGDMIDSSTVQLLGIAEARYFDFDR